MAYDRKDYYFKKAKTENFAARSIYKLEEIDAKYRLIRSGDQILDLGAAPGSWSQYASNKVGLKGRVLGIDLQSVPLTLQNAQFIQADLRDLNLETTFLQQGWKPPFDGVLSDMAPKTTGIRVTDQARSVELCELALNVAQRFLKYKGYFVCKLFHSDDFEDFRKKLRVSFDSVDVLRPKSTRKESKEIFLIGVGFKSTPATAPL